MAGEGKEVAAQGRYIDRHVRDGLGRIDEQQGTVVMAELRDLLHRGYHAEHIRCVGHGDQAGSRGNGPFERIEVKGIIGPDPDNIQVNALFLQVPPRQQVGVVLEDGRHDPVTGSPREPGSDHIDRFGGVLDKYREPFLGPDEPCHLLVGMPVALARDVGETVDAPPDISAVTVLELNHGPDDRFRGKTRCPVVEIDDIAEDREVFPHFLHTSALLLPYSPFPFPWFSLLLINRCPGLPVRAGL